MRQTFRSRVTAILLAALFLGGVGGASDLDALLFHGSGARAASAAPHVEPAGTWNHHADHCLLTLRTSNGDRAAPLRFPVRFEGITQHAAALRPTAVPPRFDPGLHQDSRAPPVSLA
jgi:hypothetical protein